MRAIPIPVATIGLLIASNVFMTFAWYGHLRFKALPMLAAILISWGIALGEYMLQVPANRIGYGYFTAAQLKTIQEVVTLAIFIVFSVAWLHEPVRWNYIVGFGFILLGADYGRAALLALIPLAAVFNRLSFELLWIVAFGCATLSLVFTLASVAVLPAIVRQDQLVDANAKLIVPLEVTV